MRKVALICLLMTILTSCKVFYPNRMLRTGPDYPYAELPSVSEQQEYRIAPNDLLSISLSSNNGEKLLTNMGSGSQSIQQQGTSYMVEYDGTVNLPVLRRVALSGLTLREAEKMLEEKYAQYYNSPYVQLKVMNNRVIIFPGGEGGSAQVLTLENPNTTLFEALARAGGISDGKAYKIKLIRGTADNRKVYLIDLSKIDGLKQADIVLMANDIIYVEPRYRLPQKIIGEVSPYLSLVSTALLIYGLFIK